MNKLTNIYNTDEYKIFIKDIKSKINHSQIKIATTDKEIDKMVYELYGLSEEEIKIFK